MRIRCWVYWAAIAAIVSAGLPAARAHHAMEFIEVESTTLLPRGGRLFYWHYDYLAEDRNDPSLDRWELTPGLAWGITDRLMIDAHLHYARFSNGHLDGDRQPDFEPDGPSPFFEAAAFTLQYGLSSGGWVDVAVSGTVEVPFSRARDLLGSETVYEGCLILSRAFGHHANVTLNLIAGIEDDEDYQGYALGVRAPLTADPHGIAAGIEWLGEFDDFKDSWSILPGVYLPLGTPQTILKLGFEMSRNMESTRAHASLLYNF